MPETIPTQVSISDKRQLEFWCKYFNCTPQVLQEAIKKIGTCTEEVQLYLRKGPGKKGLSFWWEYMK